MKKNLAKPPTNSTSNATVADEQNKENSPPLSKLSLSSAVKAGMVNIMQDTIGQHKIEDVTEENSQNPYVDDFEMDLTIDESEIVKEEKENSPLLKRRLLSPNTDHIEKENTMQMQTKTSKVQEDQKLEMMDLIIDDSLCEEDNDGFNIDDEIDLDLDIGCDQNSAENCQLLEIKIDECQSSELKIDDILDMMEEEENKPIAC